MKIKTSELIGPALDWAVAQCEIIREDCRDRGFLVHMIGYGMRMPPYSTDWSQGGPIIERERMQIECFPLEKCASKENISWKGVGNPCHGYGPTPLIAAVRGHVASKLGDEVEVPEDLLRGL